MSKNKIKLAAIILSLFIISCSGRIKRIENLCLDNRRYILDNYGMLTDVYCIKTIKNNLNK